MPIDLIRAAAARGRFLSYKELADASHADWNQIHCAMNGHLWGLVVYSHHKGWPMLSAVVVNKSNVATGNMDPTTLTGFAAAAQALGYAVHDEAAFLREQQLRVFAWARVPV
ncbi:MAG TPA: hypothetical protein VKS60_06940 [Stellaceae bacterium]|nr:hypothetical protein [Stellaceae bacterium]